MKEQKNIIRYYLPGVLLGILLHTSICAQENYTAPIRPGNEPVAPGKFEASWQSLKHYEVPEWYRNAKFGIWAHWGQVTE